MTIPETSPSDVIKYRFPVPSFPKFSNWKTISFGIEPYRTKITALGMKDTKAGKAVVRIVMHKYYAQARDDAFAIAQLITDHLNSGGQYVGAKVINVDSPKPLEAIKALLEAR